MSLLRPLALSLSVVCSAYALAQECSPIFERHVAYGAGSTVVRVVAADFDSDGRPDVAAAAGSLELFLNRNGLLVRGIAVAMPAPIVNLFPVDVAGDGRTNLVAYGSTYIATLHANGDGTFRTVTSTVSGSSLGFIGDLADMNGDGRRDVVAIAQSGSARSIRVFAAAANGTFSALADAPIPTVPNTLPRAIAAGDWNRDGKADVVVGDNRVVSLYAGNGNGTFAAPQVVLEGVLTGARALAAGDFDGDGKEDLAIGGTSTAALFLSTRGPEAVVSEHHFGSLALWAYDVDLDGKVDLANSTWFALGNGDGTFRRQVANPFYLPMHAGGGRDVAFADMDGNGHPDMVIAAGNTVRIRFNRGNLRFEGMQWLAAQSDRAVAADVNEDGRDDLITFALVNLVFLSQPDGTFGEPSVRGSGRSGPGVVADFNGDSHLDLASGANWIAFGDGTGSFGELRPLAGESSLNAHDMIALDLNGDGSTDLAFSDAISSPDGVRFLMNDGTGVFTLSERTEAVRDLAAGDFNRDGRDDLLGILEGRLLLFPGGEAPVTIAEGVRRALFPGGGAVDAVDVDGDALLDVVAVADSGTELQIFGGNGNGTFRSPRTVPVSGTGSPSTGYDDMVFTAADFTGDGKTDLIAAPFDRDSLLLEQQPDGSFLEIARMETSRNFAVARGDFDDDSRPDLLVQSDSASIETYRNRCREELRAVPPVVGITARSSRTSVTVSASVPADAAGSVEFFRRLKSTDWWELESIGTAPVVAGSAVLTPEVPVGTHEIYAVYSGDGPYASSSSRIIDVRVSDQDTPARRRSVRH